ncbi:MAG: recombination mediator RecR [Burkholderiales bacterium]|jgi:recombination protein RecR|nr:recombination mediator RecR [Burkholderiales bacterium]MCE1177308.1 recombination mediator RecR [Burkholderiales bacterium]
MNQTIDRIQNLIDALRVLPNVGHKSAQRLAFTLLQHERVGAQRLAEAITDALEHLRHCSQCYTLSDAEICTTCANPKRQAHLLCVVQSPMDQLLIEQTMTYQGKYFVLSGQLNPLEGLGPTDIAMDKLLTRACDGVVQEVILATHFTNEGELTAHYIAEQLLARGLRVTRLAKGVPVGSELEQVDLGTLAQAMTARR